MTEFGTPQHFLEIEKLCMDKDAELDLLRAENAELRKAAQSLVSEIRITGTHGSWKYLAEILSKTEKEGE